RPSRLLLVLRSLLAIHSGKEHLNVPIAQIRQLEAEDGRIAKMVVEVGDGLLERLGNSVDYDDQPEAPGLQVLRDLSLERFLVEAVTGDLRHGDRDRLARSGFESKGEVVEGHPAKRARVLKQLPEYFTSCARIGCKLALTECYLSLHVDADDVNLA